MIDHSKIRQAANVRQPRRSLLAERSMRVKASSICGKKFAAGAEIIRGLGIERRFGDGRVVAAREQGGTSPLCYPGAIPRELGLTP